MLDRRLQPTRAPSRIAASVIVGALAALVLAAPALAGKPTGEYAVFNNCPLETTGVNQCVYALFSSGEVKVSSLLYQLSSTYVLQGGLIAVESPPSEAFVAALGGRTLSGGAIKVPGGLFGLEHMEGNEIKAALELVGSVTLSRAKLAAGEGTALTLPLRIHLVGNPYLGEACFVGSSTNPITLHLTTGTTAPPEPNKPIKGTPGEHESKEGGNLVVYRKDALVDNSFAAPVAVGCGSYESTINAKYHLPATAGHSTVVLEGISEFASAEAVRKSE
jgi:hypothetical protein